MNNDNFVQFRTIDYEAINKRFLELIEKADDDAKKLLIEAFIQYMNANNGENSNNHAHLRTSIDNLDKKIDTLGQCVTKVADDNKTAVDQIKKDFDTFMKRAEPFIKSAENMTWLKQASVTSILTWSAVIAGIAASIGYGIKAIHVIIDHIK